MKTVKNSIKVELTGEEQETLFQARNILNEFINIINTNKCCHVVFNDYEREYTLSEVDNACDFIDILSDENPTIE